MKMKFSVLTAVALLFASKAHSYSHNGHYLVGAIADQMLAGTPTAGKRKKLIGTVNLAPAANIPDEIRAWDPDVPKSTKPFKVTKNKKLNSDLKGFLAANQTTPDCSGELTHQEYPFTDIEVLNSPKYSAGQVGTNEHDIVHMIGFCIDVLTGKQSADNPQKITQPVALVLLVHYVGDVHQPLHVGAEYFDQNGNPADPNQTTPFAADKGGNALKLKLTPSGKSFRNFHHYWDENAVETATNNWANEILPIAQEAHKRLSFSSISSNLGGSCPHVTSGDATAPDDYVDYAGGVVADEIQKAGHRLADLL